MLVIISDLHLADGTFGSTLGQGALDLFVDRLRDMAQRASHRAGGTYRPIERIDLVLLGDVLDLVRSTRWLSGGMRPWNSTTSGEMHATLSGIVDDVLRHNAQGLADLRSLAAEGSVIIPPATQSGQPAYDGQWQPVMVRTHYMVGNNDWFLHLPGPGYDMLRQKAVHQMGLANPHNMPFPHEPGESEELLDALRRHRVLARHGDVFDPLSFAEDRDCSSLGDAIVIELVQRFVLEVERELGRDLPAAAQSGLAEIDNIRPLLMIPVWLDGLLERTCPSASIRNQVRMIWDRLADELLQLDIVRQSDITSSFDLVDGLDRALRFRCRSQGWATKIASWLHSLRGASSDSYYTHAMAEPDFRNRRARHIVYGHTHSSESIPLDASYADAYVLNQMYFNAGTWRRVYRPTQSVPGEHEFIPHESMNYLAFFQGDERGARPFETWSGTLGIGAMEGAAPPRIAMNRTTIVEPAATPTGIPARTPHSMPATTAARRSILGRRR